ncbi:MAG: hypothetical protein BWK73_44605 [Thiothrix lacustris]|uniref:Uncharacterized protein n=1 Tax=Thiothrix lacustris TaxID=525917 RepID=A0A1Y1QBC6_9GAMM|nr:MAG: hypothetical protein BWK73_44605 [Thiothrix lacustris]
MEEGNPHIETLGAAAFFNLPMNWQGLDDKTVTKLCPVPVTPEHLVREVPDLPDDDAPLLQHQRHLAQTFIRRPATRYPSPFAAGNTQPNGACSRLVGDYVGQILPAAGFRAMGEKPTTQRRCANSDQARIQRLARR